MKSLCSTCKHMACCTYKVSGGADWCDEFEALGSGLNLDWDLLQMIKLNPSPESEKVVNQPGNLY